MEVKIELNEKAIRDKVTNDRFGQFVSSSWKLLIDPYTPRSTGTMMNTAQVAPLAIHYNSPGEYVYYGYNMNFQHINPYSTYEWDIAAEQAGQKDKLYQTLNNYLRSGR